jgi:protein-L-isoaspartate O-methyltransferase
MRKHKCDITVVRDGVYIVPQTLFEELQSDGIFFEPVPLTEEEKKEFRLLSLVAEQFNSYTRVDYSTDLQN